MYKASRVLYLLSAIFAALNSLFSGVVCWAGLRLYVNPDPANLQADVVKYYEEIMKKPVTAEDLKLYALCVAIVGGALVVFYLLTVIFALWGRRNVYHSRKKTSHVLCLILGILGLEPLLIVGAGLGIGSVSRNIEQNQ